MNPWRLALLGGIGYTLPLAAWLAGAVAPAPTGMDLGAIADLIALAQVATLVLLLPALVPGPVLPPRPAPVPRGHASGPALLLVLLAWPLLVIPWLAGAPAGRLLQGQAAVLATTAGATIVLGIVRRPWPARAADVAPLVGALQLAALAGLLALAGGLFRGGS